MSANKLKATILYVFLSLISFVGVGQNDTKISEEVKFGILLSLESDLGYFSHTTLCEWTEKMVNNQQWLTIYVSDKLSFHYPFLGDSISGVYNLVIYKVLAHKNSTDARFLILFSDHKNKNIWLRAKGYVFNDMNLLFDYILSRDKRINKTILRKMLLEWVKSEPIFTDLDIECIYDGYLKNSTRNDCFTSVAYQNRLCRGKVPISSKRKKQSSFSYYPLYNCFSNQ